MFDPFLSDYRPRDNSRVRHAAIFGEIAGQKSLADVQDFLTSIRYRMTQLAAALGKIDPSKVKDPTAFAQLMVDAGNLKTRVSKADDIATAALHAVFNISPDYTPAQAVYDKLSQALRQGAPPDGAPLQRGDFVDVVNRIKQIDGVTVDLSQMPQPRRGSPDQSFMSATEPLAAGANTALAEAQRLQRLAEEAARHGVEAPFDIVKWYRDHETEVLVVGAIVTALWLYSIFAVGKAAAPYVLPVAKNAAKAYIPGVGMVL